MSTAIPFFMMMAANVTVAEQPIDGQTGCWWKEGSAVVSSGMRLTGVVLPVAAVQNLYVYSRGAATSVTVSRGGVNVSNGGVVRYLDVPGGITFVRANIVYSGGLVENATVGGAHLTVSNGGVASGVTVDSSGTLRVSSGGTALAVTSATGATIDITAGGYVEYTHPIDGTAGAWLKEGDTVVSSGFTLSGITLPLATLQTLNVWQQGVIENITISRGTIYVHSGGVISGENVPDQASFVRNTIVYSGGTAYAVTLGYRGTLNVSEGGIASGVTVNSGTLNVSSGGSALAVTSNAGATVNVLPGGYIEYA